MRPQELELPLSLVDPMIAYAVYNYHQFIAVQLKRPDGPIIDSCKSFGYPFSPLAHSPDCSYICPSGYSIVNMDVSEMGGAFPTRLYCYPRKSNASECNSNFPSSSMVAIVRYRVPAGSNPIL